MRVLVIAAAVDGLAVHGEQHVAGLHPGRLRRATLADGMNVDSALRVAELQPLAERGVLGARDGHAQAGKPRIHPAAGFREKARHDVGGGDIADLVLGVVADEHAGQLAAAEHRQRVAARRVLHRGLDHVSQKVVAGQQVGGDVDALQVARGEQRQAVVLELQDLQGIADRGRRGDRKGHRVGKQDLALGLGRRP